MGHVMLDVCKDENFKEMTMLVSGALDYAGLSKPGAI